MRSLKIGWTLPQVAGRVAGVAMLALAFVACDADSPTAPQPAPAAPGTGTGSSTAWSITVSTNPTVAEFDETTGAVTADVFVSAVEAANGQPPPPGATLTLSTSLGTLDSSVGSGGTVVVPLTNGNGSATLTVPATGVATVILQAQLEQSIGQATFRVVEAPPPPPPPLFIVEGVSPPTGPPDGSRVNVLGSGFDEPVRVFFGNNRANVVAVTENSITVDTPPVEVPINSIQTVDVRVEINVNDPVDTPMNDTLPQGFTYVGESVDIPRIISLSPTSGPNEGGTRVTIRGEGFASEVQVFFGNATRVEAPVNSVSSNRIVVTTPAATGFNSANENSIVDVQVINSDTGFQTTLAGAFQFGNPDAQSVLITSAGPTVGPYFGGQNVSIFGRGFDEPVAVDLAGVGAQIISVTGTEIIVRSSAVIINNCQDVSGPIGVTNIETGEGDSALTYTYLALEPAIFDLSPSSSPEVGGGAITISGVNFFEPIRVIFSFPNGGAGDVAVGGVTVIDENTIAATIPAFRGGFDTETCDDNGDGEEGERNVPTSVDVTVLNLATDCDNVFESGFTYIPADQSCRGDNAPLAAAQASFLVTSVVGTTANFQNTSTGTPTITYLWDFGDGMTSTVTSPSHDYAGASSGDMFTVTLTATNAGGSTQAMATVTIP